MILTIKTDQPDAAVGVYDVSGKALSTHTWYAHRQLSNTLLGVMRDQLAGQQAGFDSLTGIVVFKGPGSFTGLRIGATVANTLAYSLSIPVVGIADEHQWLERGLQRLQSGQNDKLVLPEYGAEAHITKPRA